ncbi:MAG: acyl-CoA dehydrogenase [Proteobacteria bacterium]|nr:MAG: acyl-CoA dehydrogenase [Pseudomonadota bacterium]
MAEIDAFRDEIARWIAANAPKSLVGAPTAELEGVWGGRKAKWSNPDQKRWLDACAERGLTAPEWPRAYGGGGLTREEAKAFRQELAKAKLPPPLIGFGLTMIGPTLLMFGNEEQKREHLPKICRGEIRWCQGYSEPGAGSDLAGLQTRAVLDGDHYVLNGQKIWTSYADLADWQFCLVRTDPNAKKQEGITFLLFDMDTPGVSVKPIRLISGSSPFCETFLTDVRVPVKNVVGKVNGGWTVAKALLAHERTMIADAFGGAAGGGKSKGLSGFARDYLELDEAGRLADASLRHRIAQTEMDTRAFLLTTQRARDAAKAGHAPGSESSMFKVYGTELNQRRLEVMLAIAGPQALGWEGAGFDDAELAMTRDWLRSRANTIEGGTSEIQLNIIAKRVLGLPD